jgi:hypothetical protein
VQSSFWAEVYAAPGPPFTFRECVNIVFARSQKFQEAHSFTLARLANAEKNRVFSNAFFGRQATKISAKQCNSLDGVFSIVVVPWHAIEVQKRKQARAVLFQSRLTLHCYLRLGGWKSRVMVDRYAKFATEHLAVAAARIESGGLGKNVGKVLRFPYAGERKAS